MHVWKVSVKLHNTVCIASVKQLRALIPDAQLVEWITHKMEPHQAGTTIFCKTRRCHPINSFSKVILTVSIVNIEADNPDECAENGCFVFRSGRPSRLHYRCCGGCWKPHNSRILRCVSTLYSYLRLAYAFVKRLKRFIYGTIRKFLPSLLYRVD